MCFLFLFNEMISNFKNVLNNFLSYSFQILDIRKSYFKQTSTTTTAISRTTRTATTTTTRRYMR